MTAIALVRFVVFWGGLTIGVVKLVVRAYDAGRKRELTRVRQMLARRRKGRALPWAQEME